MTAVAATRPGSLVQEFRYGLDAPICLTWELTYACNLACVHCLSSSGRRDPRELSTSECKRVIDELERMQVFYVNIGGGEPTVRADFWELVDYATAHHVGVKFSTNGVKITPPVAARLAASDYVDVQISLDGATAEVNDAVRGPGSYAMALRAMQTLADAGFAGFKISVVMTRHNVDQLDAFKAIADRYAAQLRITRLRPSGRGADVWSDLHPTAGQQRQLYDWLVARGESVLTGDSFFHLAGYGQGLAGLNMCGAGRVVCLIDPVGDVYACPFAIHDAFLAGNVPGPGGFADVSRSSELFSRLRTDQSGGACSACSAFDACQGGCMAAKFFTGLPMDGPDPECVRGFGEAALAAAGTGQVPRPAGDHSHGGKRQPVPVSIGPRPGAAPPVNRGGPDRACDESPLAGLPPGCHRVTSRNASRDRVRASDQAAAMTAPGRVAIVTGAARGIGAATVRALADGGWSVLAVDRARDDPAVPYPLASAGDLAAVVAAAAKVAGDADRVAAFDADVRDVAALAAAVADAEARWDGLDAAIACAGVIAGGLRQWEVPPEQERAVLDIDLGGVLNLARVAVPALLRRPEPRSGRFLAVASAAASRGLPMLAAYCAAKAGVAGLVRALAVELGPTGVTANAVSPGSTATAMLDESARLYGLAGATDFASTQPAGRLLAPDEIAAVLAFLAGPASSAMTGAVVPADGGLAL